MCVCQCPRKQVSIYSEEYDLYKLGNEVDGEGKMGFTLKHGDLVKSDSHRTNNYTALSLLLPFILFCSPFL